MKKTIFFLIALFCVVFLYAQKTKNRQFSNKDFFTKAELVIEGQYMRLIHTYNLKGTDKYEDGFEIYAIKVIRVYKGNQSLADDTVYVVNKGGLVGQEKSLDGEFTTTFCPMGSIPVAGTNYHINYFSPRIYFLVTSDLPDDANSKYDSITKYKYVWRNTGEFIMKYDTMFVLGDKVLGLDNLVFQNREDFYNYMKHFRGFTVP